MYDLNPGLVEKEDGIVLGIDLGTTHTVVSFMREGEVKFFEFQGSHLLDSCVFLSQSEEVYIGREASQKGGITSFKTVMSTPQEKILSGGQGRDATPLELSAHLLRYVYEQVQRQTSQDVRKVVITVPAYFDDAARQATKKAAYLAGFEVLRLINEPTAAALAYGLGPLQNGDYLVYDFGGGTFDATLLNIGEDGVLHVLGTRGDLNLGGDLIDEALMNMLKEDIVLTDAPSLRKRVRLVKESLSDKSEVILDSGRFFFSDELDEVACPLIQRTLDLCEGLLADVHMSIQELDGIILVGGSTRLLKVHDMVKKFAKEVQVISSLNPDKVVSCGAAIQAHALTYGASHLLLDVTPLSLGIEMMGGIVEKIIYRNSPIPISVSQEFTTYVENQSSIKIHVLQGEREYVDSCRSLATFFLKDIPPQPAGIPKIQVTFQIDADGILSVYAKEKNTQNVRSIVVNPSYGLSHDLLRDQITSSFEKAQEDMENRFLTEVTLEANQVIFYVKKSLKDDWNLLEFEERECLDKSIESLEEALKMKDRHRIRECSKSLAQLSQPLAEKRIFKMLQESRSRNKSQG